ncbi:MAG: FIST C-terminal domain-containing protein [Phycisphaerae bacterium]|nr:FIST C-terminal domain-containing protein [Phycisphaerae bacterium]
MRIRQAHLRGSSETLVPNELASEGENLLVLVFGSVEHFDSPGFGPNLRSAFPHASIVGCTTAGEITRDGAFDDSLTVTSVELESTKIRTCLEQVPTMSDSEAVGLRLASSLASPDLKHVLVLSDGVSVNGSALVRGLIAGLGNDVPISGGLAGDGGRFERTLLLHGDEVRSHVVVAVGIYGDAIRASYGCVGGWAVFGPRRTVTKADENVVYELDGKPILEMYERYLGDEAKDLPGSGLLYPLAMLSEGRQETGIIRTLLGINRQDGSITFAGNIEQGSKVQLMYAQDQQLIDGAAAAARQCLDDARPSGEALALMVSCVGRKLLLRGKAGDEVRACVDAMGQRFTYTGFYSNGEIAPFRPTGRCELHNETMTITALHEEGV